MIRWRNKFLTLLSWVLGIIFILYGTVKLGGGQFVFHHDWTIDGQTTDGPTLVWCFFGYSSIYGRLIGMLELVPGLLLLWPRTRLLGALILLAVAGNITVMDFCFDFSAVKYFALCLTLGCLTLILGDWDRIKQAGSVLLRDNIGRVELGGGERSASWQGSLVLLSWILLIGFLVAHQVAAGIDPGPVEAARARCVEQGWPGNALKLLRWQASSWSGFHVSGTVDFTVNDDNQGPILHVDVYRPHAFTYWRVIGVKEMANQGN